VVDVALANYALDTTGTVALLNGVATGTDFTNRIGRKVCWKSIVITGVCESTNATAAVNLGRVMIIYDSQPNGALPVGTDVLLTASALSPMNLNNRDRFRVIMDKYLTFGIEERGAGTSVADKTVNMVHKYKKITYETIFDGTAATIADIQSGSIFILTVGTTAAALGHIMSAQIRLRFTDA